MDITETCRNLIVRAYGEYRDAEYADASADGKTRMVCKSRVLDSVSLGYYKISVESPALDENGQPIMKNGKPVMDKDTETVPLDEDIDAYFKREVLPYNPKAKIVKSKTKVGYEIPFTRTFYEFKEVEPADEIAKRIEEHERSLMEKLRNLFGKTD